MTIYVRGFREKSPDILNSVEVNTTSTGTMLGLSPFYCGNCTLYAGHSAKLMENAWQFGKAYSNHFVDGDLDTDAYYKWATAGWEDNKAHRYPMGKGAVPVCSVWDGEFLNYVQARIRIYFPLYKKAVRETEDWQKLKRMYAQNESLCLVDYDGRRIDRSGESQCDVLFNERKKMGHAFVLKAMLEYGEDVTVNKLMRIENRLAELKDCLNTPVVLKLPKFKKVF